MTDGLLGQQMHGSYTILSLVAEGGMGRVYRARDDVEGDEVAVKRVPFSEVAVSAKPLFESDLLRVLRHPNLLRVRDSFRDGSAHYLVMDYITGPTLHEVVKVYEHLEPRLAVAYALDVLQVLDYLHCQPRPIIHRDIKATNLKFHEDGRLMVVDFGIAKVLAPHEYTRMSAKGLTPGYGPPEQYTGGTDARTDLFAVGGVLYYLLTGAPPPDAMERVARGLHQLDPRQLRPEVPAGLAQIVAKATALRMDERYESAREMREALKRVRASLLALYPAPPLPSSSDRKSYQHENSSHADPGMGQQEQWRAIGPVLLAVLLLSVLAVGAWGIWWATSSPEIAVAAPTSSLTLGIDSTHTPEARSIQEPLVTVPAGTRLPEVTTTNTPEALLAIDPSLQGAAATISPVPPLEVAASITEATPAPLPRIVEFRAAWEAAGPNKGYVVFESAMGYGANSGNQCHNLTTLNRTMYPGIETILTAKPHVEQRGNDIYIAFEADSSQAQGCGGIRADERITFHTDIPEYPLGVWVIRGAIGDGPIIPVEPGGWATPVTWIP
jgi:serine/threonine-protein kinase